MKERICPGRSAVKGVCPGTTQALPIDKPIGMATILCVMA
jgi:hypothetical protein